MKSSVSDHLFGYLRCRRIVTVTRSGTEIKSNKSRREEMYHFIVSVRMPAWLINRAWEIQYMKARKGWNFNLSIYNIVPHNSLVFQYATSGNLEGLRDLFKSGLASPFDMDMNGFTVLHVSIVKSQAKESRLYSRTENV